jgi:uncharacterized protein YndB with AHSA1/START domain
MLLTKNNKTTITAEPGKQEIIFTHEFDAPQELVFKAFTDPKLYIQWLGPRGLTMTLETFEPRNGGSWRYVHKDQEGNEYAFHGVNHEVTSPERRIYRDGSPWCARMHLGHGRTFSCNTGGVYG